MILNRKVLRTMMAYKSRYIGAILMIIVCCALYTAFHMSVPHLQQGLDDFKQDHAIEDAYFMTQEPLQDLEAWEEEYHLTLEERLTWDYSYDDDVTLRMLSETEKLNRYSVIDGTPIQGNNDILIDPHFASAHSLHIGDKLSIAGEDYTIQGFVAMPDYIYILKTEDEMAPNSHTFGVAIMSKEALQSIDNGYPYYSIKFNENNREEVKEKLAEQYLITQWTSQHDNPRITFIDGKINAFAQIGMLVPTVILVLTCMLIAAMIARLLKGEYIEIGTLFGLGYTKREIVCHYLMYPVIVALIGSMIGTFVGQYLTNILLMSFTQQFNLPNLGKASFILIHVIISLAVPLLLLVAFTLFVIMKGLKLSPQELMRGKQVKTNISWLERRLKLNRFSFDMKFRIRDMVRSTPRLFMMILGVTFASMLLLMGFTTKDSIDYLFNHSLKETFTYENLYIYNDMQFDDVEHGEKVSISSFEVEQEGKDDPYTFSIYGIQNDTEFINLRDEKDNEIDKEQVVVTKSLANNLKLNVGDTMAIKNKYTSEEFNLTIDVIADTYVGEYLFMPIETFNRLNDYPEGSYTALMSNQTIDIDEDRLQLLRTSDEVMTAFEEATKPVKFMVGGVSVVAFILGLIIMFIVTSMMIDENKMNISLLKVLGYEKKKIYSLVLSSNVILVVIGFILAIPLILLSIEGMFQSIAEDLKMTLPSHLKTTNILIGFVIIFVTYMISNRLARKRIMAIPMADILKNREE